MVANYSSFIGLLPFNDEVTVVKQSKSPTIDEWGDPVYEVTTQKCKANVAYNYKLESIGIANGTTIVYTATIYIKGACIASVNDKIQFVDACGNAVEKTIEYMLPVKDLSGRVVAVKVVV